MRPQRWRRQETSGSLRRQRSDGPTVGGRLEVDPEVGAPSRVALVVSGPRLIDHLLRTTDAAFHGRPVLPLSTDEDGLKAGDRPAATADLTTVVRRLDEPNSLGTASALMG